MKPTACLLFALAALWPLTSPAVTIDIDAEVLKAADGSAMGQSGLVILTAATTGVFSGPSGNNFTTGGEIVLYTWDLSAWATDGVLSDTTGDISFSGSWNQGDALRLYWYPTLVPGATGPNEGINYGTYSDSVGLDGSSPWFTPEESHNINLKFSTSDATFLFIGGSNDPGAGLANLVVPGTPVPDHGNTLLQLGLGLVGFVIVRRFEKFSGRKVPITRSL